MECERCVRCAQLCPLYLVFSCHQHEILSRASHFRILHEAIDGDKLNDVRCSQK